MTAAERKRKATEDHAIATFDTLLGTRKFSGRSEIIRYIRAQPQPMSAAKRRAKALLRSGVLADMESIQAIDHSDVQELRVKIIRKHAVIDTAQSSILDRMDQMIAKNEMTRDRFHEMASTVLKMPCAVPPEARDDPRIKFSYDWQEPVNNWGVA